MLLEVYEFDAVVESCVVEMRKPDKEIFDLILSKLELQPNEAIFVDDLESNVTGAETHGLKGIHVRLY